MPVITNAHSAELQPWSVSAFAEMVTMPPPVVVDVLVVPVPPVVVDVEVFVPVVVPPEVLVDVEVPVPLVVPVDVVPDVVWHGPSLRLNWPFHSELIMAVAPVTVDLGFSVVT